MSSRRKAAAVASRPRNTSAIYGAPAVTRGMSTEGPMSEPTVVERVKKASRYLRGTIAEGLVDERTGALAEDDTHLTKFHGIYQQDDRDQRLERTKQKLEPAYSFMARVRVPGGICSSRQWLALDELARTRGNG